MLPHRCGQPATGTQCGKDIDQRVRRIGEEHQTEAGVGGVERPSTARDRHQVNSGHIRGHRLAVHARGAQSPARGGGHLGHQVHRRNPAVVSHLRSQCDRGNPRAATEVDDTLTGLGGQRHPGGHPVRAHRGRQLLGLGVPDRGQLGEVLAGVVHRPAGRFPGRIAHGLGCRPDLRGHQHHLAEHAVDEPRRFIGGQFFGEFDGLIDSDGLRNIVGVEQFPHRDAQNSAVDGG